MYCYETHEPLAATRPRIRFPARKPGLPGILTVVRRRPEPAFILKVGQVPLQEAKRASPGRIESGFHSRALTH